ncbi:hypothetical protein NKG05_04520 [Oerskovia sp. M15]
MAGRVHRRRGVLKEIVEGDDPPQNIVHLTADGEMRSTWIEEEEVAELPERLAGRSACSSSRSRSTRRGRSCCTGRRARTPTGGARPRPRVLKPWPEAARDGWSRTRRAFRSRS